MNIRALASRQSQGMEPEYDQGLRACRFLVIILLLYTVAPTVAIGFRPLYVRGWVGILEQDSEEGFLLTEG